MTMTLTDPELGETTLQRMRQNRRIALAIPATIIAYLIYAAISFDIGGLVQRARLDNAAILLSDFWSYKTHVTRENRSGDVTVAIEGEGVDVDMMRGYWQAWEDAEGHRAAYAVSHVGFGLNPAARWDAMAFYDKRDCNGTELRAFAGNFLYSTGANEVAGRHTLGHFDLPLRGCTIRLDDTVVVEAGHVVSAALA